MRMILNFTLTLLTWTIIVSVPNSLSEEVERPIVKTIYFIPKDVKPQLGIDEQIDSQVKRVQTLYADLMEAHGFNRKTFTFEEGEEGEVVVHHRQGKRNDEYYQKDPHAAWREFPIESDPQIYFYLVFLDIDTESHNNTLCGLGYLHSPYRGGLFPASGGCNVGEIGINVIAHELAHGFGLAHDDRSDIDAQRIYLYATDTMITSFCAAAWFNVHPAFNIGTTTLNNNTIARMFDPELASPPYSIRLRFEISDPDGLHTVKLLSPTSDGDQKLRDCKVLNGDTDITVEFVSNDLPLYTDTIVLRMRDVLGNYKQQKFKLSHPLPFPPPEEIRIVDPHLTTAIQKQIGKITTRTIINLTELHLPKKGIRDLMGLQYARNLTKLNFAHNDISDVSQISKLIRLRWLNLYDNPITDASTLSTLTGLRLLDIGFTQISDISSLNTLKNLEFLGIHGTGISVVPPLTVYKKLTTLYLHNNTISDITPLTALTQLNVLFLSSNDVSNISSLSALTQLRELYLRDNAVSDLSPLSKLTQLYVLELDNNRINDVSPLTELVNLKRLYLVNNPIQDIKPLQELIRKKPNVKIYLENRTEPLPVTLSHFRAEHTDTGILLKWTTESEVDNAGFYIYRSETEDGEFKVINHTMIQGAGTTGERNEYRWMDTTAKQNTVYYYRIEDVTHAGERQQLATVRLRGFVSATGKRTTRWSELKMSDKVIGNRNANSELFF